MLLPQSSCLLTSRDIKNKSNFHYINLFRKNILKQMCKILSQSGVYSVLYTHDVRGKVVLYIT